MIGIPAAASLVNFVVLTAAASSANSGIFSTSRMLFGFIERGEAPKQFSQLSKRSVPANGLLFTSLCLSCGIVLIYFYSRCDAGIYASNNGLCVIIYVYLEYDLMLLLSIS